MDDRNRQKRDRRSLPPRQVHEAIDRCVAGRQADHLRVTAQLIDAASEGHPWAESWDRPTAGICAVQTEIAQKIGAALAGFPGGSSRRPAASPACANGPKA